LRSEEVFRMEKGRFDISPRRGLWLAGAALLAAVGISAPLAAAERSAPASASAVPPVNVAPPRVAGTAQVGQILRASPGTWQGDRPMAFSFQWQSCNGVAPCVDVEGATDRIYTPSTADLGKTLRVSVAAQNQSGEASASSQPTVEAGPAAVGEPVNTVPPSIAGLTREGQTLVAQPGSWTGVEPIRFVYQWRMCDASGGACRLTSVGGRSYLMRSADVGKAFRVLVGARSTAAGRAVVSFALSTPTGVVAPLGSAPVNTGAPTISGTTVEGETLTAHPGEWRGAQPVQLAFQWQRCDRDGSDCRAVQGAARQTFRLEREDVGHRIRLLVEATNRFGHATALSGMSGVVAEAPPPPPPPAQGPKNVVTPTISGAAVQGVTLTANPGRWEGTQPISITYQWVRCNANLTSCPAVSGANRQTFRLDPEDVGHRLFVRVIANNKGGTSVAPSAPTGVVEASTPPPPPTSRFMSVSQIALPNRLIIDRIEFSPSRVTQRATPLVARFHVSEVNTGRSVAGALVYAVAVPFNRLSNRPEVTTGQDGWATITFRVLNTFPIKNGYLITMFTRARKPGGSVLAGVSTRRLVSVRVG
jgi:hypothetical protein